MKLPTYEYSFEPVPDGGLRGLRLSASRNAAALLFHVNLAQASLVRAGDALDPRVRDLLDLVVAVTAADRLSHRRPNANGDGWGRCLHVTLPVREPDFWNQEAVTDLLRGLLNLLTCDEWLFDWRSRPALAVPGDEVAQAALLDVQIPATGLILLSDGLDSFAGICGLLRDRDGARYGLVSVATSGRVAGVQREVYAALKGHFRARVYRAEVPLILSHSIACPGLHRTRSFLFQAVGAVAAHGCGLRRLYQCENGIASLCLPLSPSSFPWQSARGVHPRSLDKVGTFLSMVFGSEFRIENPYLLHTKAQMCGAVRDTGLGWAAGLTISCDRFPQRVPGQPACGKCGPCLLRRQALYASGLSPFDLPRSYRYDVTLPTTRVPQKAAQAIAAIVGQRQRITSALASAEPWRTLTQAYPELEATKRYVAIASGLADDAMEREILTMLDRFVKEWDLFPICGKFEDIASAGDRRRVKHGVSPALSLSLFDRPSLAEMSDERSS
jgi:hypothetical protein